MANKKKTLTDSEVFEKTFNIAVNSIQASDELYMKTLELRIKSIQDRIELQEDTEPLKLFKKAHKKWSDELADLEKELRSLYEKYENEIDYQANFYESLASSSGKKNDSE